MVPCAAVSAHTDVFHYDGLTYWGPMSVDTMESLLDQLALPDGGRALDVGCGRGELLTRLVERFGLEVVGVDRSGGALEQTREQLRSRTPDASFELIESDANEVELAEASFDVVSWLGGPYLGESFATTMTQLAAWARPGGFVLVGHGFWMQPPPGEYLAETGIDRDELTEHWENINVGIEAGLTPLYCCQSDLREWDTFEGTILRNVELHAAAHPDDPDPQGRLEQRRSWHLAQQRWGRQVMGFGLYLFLR